MQLGVSASFTSHIEALPGECAGLFRCDRTAAVGGVRVVVDDVQIVAKRVLLRKAVITRLGAGIAGRQRPYGRRNGGGAESGGRAGCRDGLAAQALCACWGLLAAPPACLPQAANHTQSVHK